MTQRHVKRQGKYILSRLNSFMDQLTVWEKSGIKDGFYILSEKIVQNMKKIRTDNSESNIYRLDNFIFKIPKSALYHDNIIRSYYIGKILNNLSCILPNFVNTTGIFSYEKQVIVAHEYIPGETLESLLVKKKLTCKDFLNSFVQILFALEIAQKQYRFCHYDLHLKNIIMKPISKPYNYTIVIDTKRYDLVAEKYIPIIIDFGLASIHFDGVTVGSHDFPQFGMMPYLIQGVDMYKFLFHTYAKSQGEINRCVSSLFLFYGSYDPYRLLVTPIEKIPAISKTYLKKVSFSHCATYTPLEFIMWIVSCPEYNLSVKISNRDIYFPVRTHMFLPKMSSYVMTKYSQKIAGKDEPIDEKMIESDLEIFSGYKIIEIPDEITIKDQIATVLNTEFGKSRQFILNFTEQMKPYLQCLYTIRELGLEKTYNRFVSEFVNSKQYQIYQNISFEVDKAKRWSATIEETLK
jgi:hypothetical protein